MMLPTTFLSPDDLDRVCRAWGLDPQTPVVWVPGYSPDLSEILVPKAPGDEALPPEALGVDPRGYKLRRQGWVSYLAFPNPDGSLRWLTPEQDRRGTVLAFYHASTLRGRLLATIWRVALFLGLATWLGARRVAFRFPLTRQPQAGQRPDTLGWMLFTGTPGPDRKTVVFDRGALRPEKPGQPGRPGFVKTALDPARAAGIRREAVTLQTLQALQRTMPLPARIPQVVWDGGSWICVEDVRPAGAHRSRRWLPAHAEFIAELALRTRSQVQGFHPFWEGLEQSLAGLPRTLQEDAQMLWQALQENKPTVFCRNHGDFTPWNIWVGRRGELAVYDWEMSAEAPALFDLFHFVVQGSALLDLDPRKAPEAAVNRIESRLAAALAQPQWSALFREGDLEPQLHVQAYLLWMLGRYAANYAAAAARGEASPAEEKLLAIWSHLLRRETRGLKRAVTRRELLAELESFLPQQGIALLKHRYDALDALPEDSDLDLLLSREKVPVLLNWLDWHPAVVQVQRQAAPGMINALLLLRDHSLLSIDLLFSLERKGRSYARASEFLEEARPDARGLLRLPAHREWEYLVAFYQLNGQGLPEKYRHEFEGLPQPEQEACLQHLSALTEIRDCRMQDLIVPNPGLVRAWWRRTAVWPENAWWRRWPRQLQWAGQTLRNMLLRRGFILTLSGVDGAGKSTILLDLERTLRQQYRQKVVVLRHRPSVLPMLNAWRVGRAEAERQAAERLPRQGNNSSLFSSLARFAYYYTDYLIGQTYVWFRWVLRGYIVLYDRYYFDFIVDGKRSNLQLPGRWIRAGWWLLAKPAHNFYLYAPEEVILARKQELDGQAIRELNEGYLNLFRELEGRRGQGRYLPVLNLNREQTIRKIMVSLSPSLNLHP